MDIEIAWTPPIMLARNKRIVVDRDDLPEEIPPEPGVYFFSRKFGERYHPFYIGETVNIRMRIRNHLKDADIRDVLRGMKVGDVAIRQGNKFLHCGIFNAKRGQSYAKCISIIQRYLIEEAIAKKCVLLNKQLTKIKTHTVRFSGSRDGKAIFPATFNVELQ